jgi:hypothetical protein
MVVAVYSNRIELTGGVGVVGIPPPPSPPPQAAITQAISSVDIFIGVGVAKAGERVG